MSPWFVLALKPRYEKNTAADLACRGIEHYLPLFKSRRRWSDRFKEIEAPLFPGYLFCRFGYHQRLEVLNLPGVNSIVGYGKVPAPVPESELDAVRSVVGSGRPVMPWPYLRAGQRVRIEQGPLNGLEGTLARDAGLWRVVVSVELLQRSVAVEIDREIISPVSSFTPTHHPVHARLQTSR